MCTFKLNSLLNLQSGVTWWKQIYCNGGKFYLHYGHLVFSIKMRFLGFCFPPLNLVMVLSVLWWNCELSCNLMLPVSAGYSISVFVWHYKAHPDIRVLGDSDRFYKLLAGWLVCVLKGETLIPWTWQHSLSRSQLFAESAKLRRQSDSAFFKNPSRMPRPHSKFCENII